MRLTNRLVLVLSVLLVLVGSSAWFLFTPPSATGTPAVQPYQIDGMATEEQYLVVTNVTRDCDDYSPAVRVTMSQATHVDRSAGILKSHRVALIDNRTFTFSTYQNGSTLYRRSVNGSGSPTYERKTNARNVDPTLERHLPVFPRVLRYEWKAVSNETNRITYRPREGYWVDPATNYGVTNRLFVESAEGRLVTTADGTLIAFRLEAETIRATNRFQRYLDPREKCTARLQYRYRPTQEAVSTPSWVETARNETRTA